MDRIFRFLQMALCLTALQAHQLKAEDPRIEAGFVAAKKVALATKNQDSKVILESMYPRALELLGDRATAKIAMEKAFAELREQGAVPKSISVLKPIQNARSGTKLFSVFPTITVLSDDTKRLTAKSSLLGISSDGGKVWKFLDGTGLSDPNARKLLVPDLPPAIKIPGYTEEIEQR